MKLKHGLYLLMFIGIFVFVYKNCDRSGFRRISASYKLAIVITASVLGLLPNHMEANAAEMPNNVSGIERVVSRIKESRALIEEAETMGQDQK